MKHIRPVTAKASESDEFLGSFADVLIQMILFSERTKTEKATSLDTTSE